MTVIIGAVIYIGITSQKRQLKKKMVSSGNTLKHLAYAGIKHPMSVGDSASVEKQLLDIKKTVEGLDIMICNFDGDITFATDESMIGGNVSEFISSGDIIDALKDLLKTGEQDFEKSLEEERDGRRYLISLFGMLNAKECRHCHGSSRKVLGGLIVSQSNDDTYAAIASLRRQTIFIGILGTGAIITLLYLLLARLVTRPAIEYSRKAEEMASGDLTAELETVGDDEIASLGSSINRMASNLKSMVKKVDIVTKSISDVTDRIVASSGKILDGATLQHSITENTVSSTEEMDSSIANVAESAENLSLSAGDTSSAIFEMKASIEKIAENTDIFSETAVDTASSIEEMVSTIKRIAESLENLSISSGEIASSIDEVNATTRDIEQRANESVVLAEQVMSNASDHGMNASHAAIEGMEGIKESVLNLSETINMLGKKTDDIGRILHVIDDVADQTNLLALNAAILASKAGEYGKGFSVVSNEIRDLAERTSTSTHEISALITSVQKEAQSSISKASQGIQAVENGMKLAKKVNDALGEIVASAKASTTMAKAIQHATAEEAIVIKQIADAAESMTVQTEKISQAIQEQSMGSRFILEASEKVKDLSKEVRTATGEQKEVSRQIVNVIENVTQRAAQIANATGMQKERSTEIVQSIENIRSTTGNLISSSHEMKEIIISLQKEALNLVAEMKQFKIE